MSDKPSYLGLLNAIANGESQAECYLNAWAATTPDDGVRQVISTVALREGEHGKAFAKRLCELGYTVLPREDPKFDEKMAIAGDKHLTDREKFEKLGFSPAERSEPSGPGLLLTHVRGQVDRHPDRRPARPLHRRGARQRAAAHVVLPPAVRSGGRALGHERRRRRPVRAAGPHRGPARRSSSPRRAEQPARSVPRPSG